MNVITDETQGWYENLSPSFWVNSVGISNDGGRLVAATFFHNYKASAAGDAPANKPAVGAPNTKGTFGTYCYDANGKQLWRDEFEGMDGVFAVAISGNGEIAAAGGWHSQDQALLRAYDASTGKSLLDYQQIQQRVNCVSLSDDGKVLAAAADDVYLFVKTGSAFPTTPLKMGIAGAANNFVTSVAVDPGGRWLAACDKNGNVHLGVISGGKIQSRHMWTAPRVPLDPAQPTSATAPVPFLAVQVDKIGRFFVVGGGDLVYLFDSHALLGEDPIEYDTRDANTPPGSPGNATAPANVRWVAISGDGTFVTAVANRVTAKNPNAGLLVALSHKNGQLCSAWNKALDHSPNSTSMNAEGTYISVADGYPVGTQGQFCLFDARGNELWSHTTSNMNWPMVVSPLGAGIAAGGDDGNVYYLSVPTTKRSLRTRTRLQSVSVTSEP